jgi:hypothetical protein
MEPLDVELSNCMYFQSNLIQLLQAVAGEERPPKPSAAPKPEEIPQRSESSIKA